MPKPLKNTYRTEKDLEKQRARQNKYMARKRAGKVKSEKFGSIRNGSAETKSSMFLATSIKHLYARRYVDGYLKDHHCVDCGYSNPLALEFDHVRGKKVGNVSEIIQLIPSKFGVKDLIDEIAKCEVRCSNCHQIRHRKK